VVQVNGRVKGRVPVEAGLDIEEMAERVLSDPKIAKLLDGQRIVKRIVVPDKLVNVVVGLAGMVLPPKGRLGANSSDE